MRVIGSVAAFALIVLFGLVAYDQLAGFASAGTLSGTNQQTIFDRLPVFALALTLGAAGVFIIAAFSFVFLRR